MASVNVEKKSKHLFDLGEWNVYSDSVLNLGVGAPGTDLLQKCCEIFQKATTHCMKYEMESNASMIFQYGPSSGTFEARSAIANYFTSAYGRQIKSEDLIITSGATQGLHLIISTLIDLTGFVFVDEVTYMIALDAMKQFSTLKLIPVKLNDDGVDLIDLEHVFKQKRFCSKSKEFWAMYYTIPVFHNPTGILFSEDVCRGIINLARKYDVLICCDDVYNILNYTTSQPPKRLFSYDDNKDGEFRGNVISNCSFSKIIGPGVRLGWLEAPARIKSLIESCGIVKSGGCLNNYMAGIIASLFNLGLAQKHIQIMHDSYKERMIATFETFSKKLPNSCNMLKTSGGFFIWIQLPVDKSADDFLQFSIKEERIYFIPGSRFSLNNSSKNCFRISIAFHNTEKLVDGATRLCEALKKYLEL